MTEPQNTDSEHPNRDALDKRHDSDLRGEHRYPDDHQKDEERRAREERDNLKKKLENQS